MFYRNVSNLCKERRTTITKMSLDIGLSNAAASSWKKGAIPKADTLQKIADYFSVSTDYLLSGGSDTNVGTISNVRESVVLQGTTGNNTINNGANVAKPADTLTDQEREVLRIFRALSMRTKSAVLLNLYELEDKERADGKINGSK